MKRSVKMLAAAFAFTAVSAAVSMSVSAEDYEFDVSSAVKTNGGWGQSYTVYTSLTGEEEHSGNFNPMWLTEDSEILVEYTYSGDASASPVELIWQTWDGGPAEPDPDVAGTWNKVAPYEYDDTSAKFSFEDIAAAYGTSNFATVYAINIGDTGVELTVTKMTATNVEITEAPAAAEGEIGDYEFDVSSAVTTEGNWGQTYTVYTSLTGESEHIGNFNPMWLTEDSEIIIEYTYEGEPMDYPADLIWQTWGDGPAGIDPDVAKPWNQIAPYEFDENSAKYSYKDIAETYGTDNFATVYAINIGDRGVKLTLTSMKATNVMLPAAEGSQETEAAKEPETEEAAQTETEAAVTTAAVSETLPTTVNIAANAPDEGGALSIVIIVVIVVVVIAAAVVVIMMMIKKNKGQYY